MMHAYAYANANANAMQLRTKHLKCYTCDRCGARRDDDSSVVSRMDAGVAMIQEESKSEYFFEQMGAFVRMAVSGHLGGHRGPLTQSVRTKRTPFLQHFRITCH
jgi:hypothetical protein